MNILAWIRIHAHTLQVSPLEDPSGYQVDYGDGVISVSWEVGDESYHLDFNMMTFTATAITHHERYGDVPVRKVERVFTLKFFD